MTPRTTFTFKLSPDQQKDLAAILRTGNYRPMTVPYTIVAAEGPDCNVSLYESGKCVVQGKGAQEWVTYVLEPEVLKEARLGYETILSPETFEPHMGVDESGKGDFFGPLVIASAYVDASLVPVFRGLDVRDSKAISSDRKAEQIADDIARVLGNRFAIVTIGPRTYNKLYQTMRSVNRILAWGHARVIENLLAVVPDCPRAISDQFGPTHQIERSLMEKGKKIELIQRTKAESDPAVAAASILARAGFLRALRKMKKTYEIDIPKGASEQVKAAAKVLVEKKGPEILLETSKCHFRTADLVLESAGLTRAALGPEGAATSQAKKETYKRH